MGYILLNDKMGTSRVIQGNPCRYQEGWSNEDSGNSVLGCCQGAFVGASDRIREQDRTLVNKKTGHYPHLGVVQHLFGNTIGNPYWPLLDRAFGTSNWEYDAIRVGSSLLIRVEFRVDVARKARIAVWMGPRTGKPQP